MKRVFCCLVVFLIVAGCTKTEKSRVPYAPVFFTVSLQYEDKELSGLLKTKSFTKTRKAGEYIGYSGIFVVHGVDENFYAFDLCCPHEAQQDVKVTPSDDGVATCSECKTVYDISYGGGYPMSGPSKHQLIRLDVIKNGQELIIRY
ncbi:hypothetical protein LJC43_07850 [Parabacteroides sp. OttesenSCG-928-G21]|nr:hypothetical protein [Parabacteroides sp. OttesenSCG-928-G21]